jgi:hypothetical protein
MSVTSIPASVDYSKFTSQALKGLYVYSIEMWRICEPRRGFMFN